jgi:hypothetical protein
LINITTTGIGTIIGRKTVVGKRHYKQVLAYIPSEVSVDSMFTSIFEIGKPVEIEVDGKNRQMIMRPIDEKSAVERGWVRRDRTKGRGQIRTR